MNGPTWWLVAALVGVTIGLVVTAIGWYRTNTRLQAASAKAREAITLRHQAIELGAATERMRILREMHDVLAHSLAIMIAQADGGSYQTEDQDAARRTFITIAETGRVALADTRRILGVLRHGDAAELAPVPTSVSLNELIDQARQAGLEVSFIQTGTPKPLPSGGKLTLYRICQEALTNVLKHAGENPQVIVGLHWSNTDLTLTVTDRNGTGQSGLPAGVTEPLAALGLGLIGMQERAELMGGQCVAAKTEDGFQVKTILPLAEGEVTDG